MAATEIFIVYDESNIDRIKELVNSILSLVDSSKTFDDYFTIEMLINYSALRWVFDRYCECQEYYNEIPELKIYSQLNPKEFQKYIKSLPIDRIKEIFYWANDIAFEHYYYLYDRFIVKSKVNDTLVEKVASIINNIDDIFYLDYKDA